MQRNCKSRSAAFTLIELLVVIAIIAILSVVVILTLNPAQLLLQSHDANRLSDLATLNTSLGIYAAEGGTSLGNANTVYISIPDPSATSSLGDQCQGLGLPTAPSGTTYACAASSTYRSTNGTGWIPVNFSSLPAGSPLGVLPKDPTSVTSTGEYYTYSTNGSQYIVTANPESQKYLAQYGTTYAIPDYPDVLAAGSNLTISPLFNASGLVGYWPFEEGSGSSTADASGNGNTGTWNGTAVGNNSTYYAGGKVGNYAGDFDGSTDYVSIPSSASLQIFGPITIAAWVYPKISDLYQAILVKGIGSTERDYGFYLSVSGPGQVYIALGSVGTPGSTILTRPWSVNTWNYMVMTANGTTVNVYVNGLLSSTTSSTAIASSTANALFIGRDGTTPEYYMNGYEDDVRVYNRALSASEILALYNAVN